MAAARVLKINRVDAARFSFLMGTPVILGAGVLSAREFQVDELSLAFWLGILASFVSGVITIHFLLALMRRVSYSLFFWYSLALVGLMIAITKWGWTIPVNF